jgi:hypothetical protein
LSISHSTSYSLLRTSYRTTIVTSTRTDIVPLPRPRARLVLIQENVAYRPSDWLYHHPTSAPSSNYLRIPGSKNHHQHPISSPRVPMHLQPPLPLFSPSQKPALFSERAVLCLVCHHLGIQTNANIITAGTDRSAQYGNRSDNERQRREYHPAIAGNGKNLKVQKRCYARGRSCPLSQDSCKPGTT